MVPVNPEQLSQLCHRVFGALDSVTNDSQIFKKLLVIAPNCGLIAKKVDLLEAEIFDMLQTESFVPSGGEYVERDLASDGEGEANVGELFDEGQAKVLADVMLLVILLELIAFGLKKNIDFQCTSNSIRYLWKNTTE